MLVFAQWLSMRSLGGDPHASSILCLWLWEARQGVEVYVCFPRLHSPVRQSERLAESASELRAEAAGEAFRGGVGTVASERAEDFARRLLCGVPGHRGAVLGVGVSRVRTEMESSEDTERGRISDKYLECPCCGNEGAEADADGWFTDGQSLICGCVGWVTVEETGEAWINNGDEPCPCEAA